MKLPRILSQIALSVGLLLPIATAGCSSEPASPQPPAPAPAPATPAAPTADAPDKPAAAEPGAAVAPAGDLATVSAQGTRFDPPIAPERIPPGAWMCEMGTVHYASMDKGDGKCPVCGMALRQQQGGSEPAAGEEDAHDEHAHH